MFSRAAFEKVGGFDERFRPVWFEDVDFCVGLKREGYLAYYVPQAVANHKGGHSVGTLPVEIRERYWYGSLLEYAAKYYRPVTFRLVCFAVSLGAVFRACRGCAAGGGWKVIKVYEAIVRLAIGRMFRPGQVQAGRVVSER
jgi:N-acetylglucosaminyl-diphospho-decaprenol L-rhamnosyltransferase